MGDAEKPVGFSYGNLCGKSDTASLDWLVQLSQRGRLYNRQQLQASVGEQPQYFQRRLGRGSEGNRRLDYLDGILYLQFSDGSSAQQLRGTLLRADGLYYACHAQLFNRLSAENHFCQSV